IPYQLGGLVWLGSQNSYKLSFLQKLEERERERDSDYKPIIRTAIVTARNAPAHERVITTLEDWGASANESFFLGGMVKNRILGRLKPYMFFQISHLESEAGYIPMVHIPFGIANS
ncbi:5'-nucleotidase, partial [Endozoicomonas sp. ONNA2]|uniref:5'-nucleotidase n=1 Tax=Endozoicomonas sp. ONNA2 TaxID=2828741 RepID=UPI0021482C93